jgi:hypothetical protein
MYAEIAEKVLKDSSPKEYLRLKSRNPRFLCPGSGPGHGERQAQEESSPLAASKYERKRRAGLGRVIHPQRRRPSTM